MEYANYELIHPGDFSSIMQKTGRRFHGLLKISNRKYGATLYTNVL